MTHSNPNEPLSAYCERLLNVGNFPETLKFIDGASSRHKFLVPMVDFWGLSTEDVDKLVSLLLDSKREDMIKKRKGEFFQNLVRPALCLMLLKIKNPELFSQFIAGDVKCKDLIDRMMKMFCDEEGVDPQCFKHCKDVVEEGVYRLAGESEWEKIIEQLELIKQLKSKESKYLAEYTNKNNRAARLLHVYDVNKMHRTPTEVILFVLLD